MKIQHIATMFMLMTAFNAFGDGERDNDPSKVRRIPKPGIKLTDQQQRQFDKGLHQLNVLIQQIEKSGDTHKTNLLPDVMIYHRAVESMIKYDECFDARDLSKADKVLKAGIERALQLLEGKAPWTTQTGLVVRGYRSRIDHSVQPYGLVIPETYDWQSTTRHRADLWFHGRGETLSEVKFIEERSRATGQYSPANTFVIHPYGRYSNAFKFAGEVDVLEALDDVRNRYRIDGNRISARGFSMGGAACWQFAVHYADRWFAANPGAGFSETPEFLKFFQKETLRAPWYEQKLWQLYDCTGLAANLFHCPTVAYSGEDDIQKQAADIMADSLRTEGIELLHIIGPKTGHRIHPDSKVQIERRMNLLAARGREQSPKRVHIVTPTLKYNRMHWITVDQLGRHWKMARINASLEEDNQVVVKTGNVKGFSVRMPAGTCPFDPERPVVITVDGQLFRAPLLRSDRSYTCSFHQTGSKWNLGETPGNQLRKQHNLQGPIDDAFMDSFIFVRPTGKCQNTKLQTWVDNELKHAIDHWRRQFRGEARVKDDSEINQIDIDTSNLVLFGDPRSNSLWAQIADNLPIRWTRKNIEVGAKTYSSQHHAVAMIYPNPLNPSRYIVTNSGFTYREYDYLNNARQVPKLPDWAIIDFRTPATSRYSGKVVNANFFDELWKLHQLPD